MNKTVPIPPVSGRELPTSLITCTPPVTYLSSSISASKLAFVIETGTLSTNLVYPSGFLVSSK